MLDAVPKRKFQQIVCVDNILSLRKEGKTIVSCCHENDRSRFNLIPVKSNLIRDIKKKHSQSSCLRREG